LHHVEADRKHLQEHDDVEPHSTVGRDGAPTAAQHAPKVTAAMTTLGGVRRSDFSETALEPKWLRDDYYYYDYYY
jgi:hypothetical protein